MKAWTSSKQAVPAAVASGCIWILLEVLTPLEALALDVEVRQNTVKLMPYQVFELTFQHDGKCADPLWNVTIEVRFKSPSGKNIVVGGFFYGSSKPQGPVVEEVRDGHGGR